MSEMQHVPLQVGWLSENDLLVKAAGIHGYTFKMKVNKFQVEQLAEADTNGVYATYTDAEGTHRTFMAWTDDLLFTLDQLEQLGFVRKTEPTAPRIGPGVRRARLADTLYLMHERSGATDEHRWGVIMGVVGTLMDGDVGEPLTFEQAVTLVCHHLPITGTRLSVPDSWHESFATRLRAMGVPFTDVTEEQ